jgi:hypothetical protein
MNYYESGQVLTGSFFDYAMPTTPERVWQAIQQGGNQGNL